MASFRLGTSSCRPSEHHDHPQRRDSRANGQNTPCGGGRLFMIPSVAMRRIDGIEHARKLWILGQVMKTGPRRGAALKSRISPPAVSQPVSSLERIVGKPLLIRTNGTV